MRKTLSGSRERGKWEQLGIHDIGEDGSADTYPEAIGDYGQQNDGQIRPWAEPELYAAKLRRLAGALDSPTPFFS